MTRAILFASVFALASLGCAYAQGAEPGFSMQPVEGGLMKLDTRTGSMSFCSSRAGTWTCAVVPEDRAAFEAEITRLHERIASLEKRGATGVPDIMAPPAAKPPVPNAAPSPDAGKPTIPEDVQGKMDEAMDMAEHVFRRFMQMVDRLRNEPPASGQKL